MVPTELASQFGDNELLSLLVMLGIGIPLYICASASTPIAAALILKGVSPGAALVFLLAGPATNPATLTVFRRYWGNKATLIYLASIAGASLLAGLLLNRLYRWFNLPIQMKSVGLSEEQLGWGEGAALVLLLLSLYHLGKKWRRG